MYILDYLEGKKPNVEMSNQSLKSSFFYKIALWIRVYIHGYSLSLVDCVDWLGSS